jgi:signal transduction histidine kinase
MCPLDLGSVLKGSIEFVRPLAQQKGVELTLREALNSAQISGDSNGLRQMILNLACNALRHTQPGGAITVTAATKTMASGQTAVVEFADTGSGIRPEDLPHIFKVGFSTTGQTPGLGLTVCQRIMEQHNGTVDVRSQLGRGTIFSLQFPVL